jgi:hypothetical protein
MFPNNASKATGAQKATAHIERALQPSQQGNATSDPSTQLLATKPGIPSLRRMPIRMSGVFAALTPTTNTRNNANMKGTK